VRRGQLVAVAVALTVGSADAGSAGAASGGSIQAQNGGLYVRNADERINPRYEQSRRLSDNAQTSGENFAGLKNFSRATDNSPPGK